MLLNYLIGAVAAVVFSRFQRPPVVPLTPAVNTSPTAVASASSTLIPVGSTFIAVTAESFTLTPVANTSIPVGALGDDFNRAVVSIAPAAWR